MVDIREQEELRANPPLPPLPSAERLLDPTTFAIECAARPAETGRLYAARAHLLVSHGRPLEAIEGFALASRLTDKPLSPVDQLSLGEAYFVSGQLDMSRRILLAIDVTRLDDAGRARANDVLGRLTMSKWQSESR
jgi:predicted Zn-dependent protease